VQLASWLGGLQDIFFAGEDRRIRSLYGYVRGGIKNRNAHHLITKQIALSRLECIRSDLVTAIVRGLHNFRSITVDIVIGFSAAEASSGEIAIGQ
jgi:hypothetical protein